jgi:uncharacterized protein
MKLHPKIKELKRRAAPISYSSVAINERGEITGDFEELLNQRIVQGYLFRWGKKNMHGEKFLKGCCSKSINERGPGSNANYKITFLNQHRQGEPLSIFADLVEDDYGLRFKSNPLDAVPWADHVITQIRSGTLNQFSGGFDYVWDKMEWDDSDESIVCKEIDLFEGSVVTIGSEVGTYVIRSKEDLEYLQEETETFINSIPKKFQYELRQIIARHKTLINVEPDSTKDAPLESIEPDAKRGRILNYLTENFSL